MLWTSAREAWGGVKAPGILVVTRFPSVVTSVVPVCVVPVCVFTSVTKCVLQRAHSVGARACVRATACVTETPCVEETPGVSGVAASVPKCVLPSTPCVKEAPRVKGATCARKMARVSERPSVRETACVRSLCVKEMTVGMREHAAASPSVSVMEWCVSVMTRRCAWIEWRRRRRQTKDKGRVAAVAVLGTVPDLHGGEREVRAVQRTRPPRARLRE